MRCHWVQARPAWRRVGHRQALHPEGHRQAAEVESAREGVCPKEKGPASVARPFILLALVAPTTLGHVESPSSFQDRGLITPLEAYHALAIGSLREHLNSLPSHPAPVSFSMCHFLPPWSMRSFRSSAAAAASCGSILDLSRSLSNSRIGTSTRSSSSSRSMAFTSNNLNASAV